MEQIVLNKPLIEGDTFSWFNPDNIWRLSDIDEENKTVVGRKLNDPKQQIQTFDFEKTEDGRVILTPRE